MQCYVRDGRKMQKLIKLVAIIPIIFCLSSCAEGDFARMKDCVLKGKGADANGNCHYESNKTISLINFD